MKKRKVNLSGFKNLVIGHPIPEDWERIENEDGTVTYALPKASGFEEPVEGKLVPKDYVRVENEDGTVDFKPPFEEEEVFFKKTKKDIREQLKKLEELVEKNPDDETLEEIKIELTEIAEKLDLIKSTLKDKKSSSKKKSLKQKK